MVTERKQLVAIFVDRLSRQWVVKDGEDSYWILPSSEKPWDDRRPFVPSEETELEPVPGHYKYMLGLPH